MPDALVIGWARADDADRISRGDRGADDNRERRQVRVVGSPSVRMSDHDRVPEWSPLREPHDASGGGERGHTIGHEVSLGSARTARDVDGDEVAGIASSEHQVDAEVLA